MIQINVISVGEPVKIGKNIDATVIAVCLRGNRVMYEVAWWDRNNRNTQWLEEFEVEHTSEGDGRTTFIGFSPTR